MSEKIVSVSGKAFHLPGDDLDTDRIIPARFLKCVTFEGLGDHAFEDDRAKLAGKHPFDLPQNQGRSILVVHRNFGSGSSREHAVPAITQRGIKAIIGLSFAEIFRGNAISYGLVCVEVTAENHNDLLAALGEHQVEDLDVDLDKMQIRIRVFSDDSDPSIPCTMPKAHREMLTTGCWDMLTTSLEAGELIEAAAKRLPYMAELAA